MKNGKILEELWKTWLDTRKGKMRCEANWYNFVEEDQFVLTCKLENISDDACDWWINHTKTSFS
tara:strand:+ start:143 stop:334 length:192 start_codon:yes stop_codon:yes gene_type:complete